MGKDHDYFLNFKSDGAMLDCNYFLEGGFAYTEDKIVVHNIFLYKISKKVEQEDVKMYFAQFGEIKKLHFLVKKATNRRRGSRVGFIHFKEAKNAAEVLAQRCHKITETKIVWVKACDSWHQPHGECSNIVMEHDSNETMSDSYDMDVDHIEIKKTGTINALDDDCLFIIYKNMRLRDQVNFACSNLRFASVFKLYAKLYYKTVLAEDLEALSLWNIRQFLILAGQFIEIFTGTFQHNHCDRVVNFIKVHCPNIQKIKLDGSRLKLTSLRKMLSNKKKLKTLYLTDCGIDDHGMFAISKLSQLEKLVISRSSNITGHHLHLLKNLTKLRLFSCGFLQSSHLLKALASMPYLRFLDLRGSEQLSKKFFEELPKLCINLEVLQISCLDLTYTNVANLPKLKNLSLSANYPVHLRMELFQRLVEEKSQELEFLQILPCLYVRLEHCEYISKLESLKKLHLSSGPNLTDQCLTMLSQLKELEEFKISGCTNISNDGLLEMMIECKKLKWVNIQNTDIDNDFVHKIVKHLKGNERPNGRMTFLVAGSKINKFNLPEMYHSECVTSLVHFEFDLSRIITSYDELNDTFESNDLIMNIPFFNHDDTYESDSDMESDYDDDIINLMNFDIAIDFLDGYHIDLHGDDAGLLFW